MIELLKCNWHTLRLPVPVLDIFSSALVSNPTLSPTKGTAEVFAVIVRDPDMQPTAVSVRIKIRQIGRFCLGGPGRKVAHLNGL